MLVIDLIKLALVLLWVLTIFNFFAIIIIIILAKGWNKTANKVFYNRNFGSYNFNAIEDLINARDKIIIRLEKLETREINNSFKRGGK